MKHAVARTAGRQRRQSCRRSGSRPVVSRTDDRFLSSVSQKRQTTKKSEWSVPTPSQQLQDRRNRETGAVLQRSGLKKFRCQTEPNRRDILPAIWKKTGAL